jgi:pimeloyl-ACP methyl ester carboxylesterase
VQESAVLIDGPWTHRDISANGIRFHIAESGAGPLVLLLHGFPEFWWAWRHQLPRVADAGFRVVAPDLRGYGATDKPPRGYDSLTLAADVAGLIRALGERDAIVVGHGWGGHVAWTVAAAYPWAVRRLVVLSAAHPSRWSAAIRDAAQNRASRHVLRFQLPWHPERWLVANDAVNIGRLLDAWRASAADEETEHMYREAMQILSVPHCAMEYYRWAVRSLPRSDGRRFRRTVRRHITAPTLQLHGDRDTYVLPETAQGSSRHVSGPYEWRLLHDVGHYPHEERPDTVTGEILRWCKET